MVQDTIPEYEAVLMDARFKGMSVAPRTDAESCNHAYGQSVCTEQQWKKQRREEPDSSKTLHTHSTSINFMTLSIRTKPPPQAGGAVKLHASNHNALPSNEETKVTPPFEIEQTPQTLHLDCKNLVQKQSTTSGKRKRESSPEAPELELFNRLEGQPNAWQLGESVEAFMERLPPRTTSASTCPWIGADNPHRDPRNKRPCPRVDYLESCGMKLLEQFLDNLHKLQQPKPERETKSQFSNITQESKALQEQIVSLARDAHVISGKVTGTSLKAAFNSFSHLISCSGS